jgi:hypothetical protein
MSSKRGWLTELKKSLRECISRLEVPFEFLYTNSMENKNTEKNVQVHELVNLITELQDKKGNKAFAHSYALGTLQAIIDWEVRGYTSGIQDALNRAYATVEAEMREIETIKLKDLQKVANEAKLEELYA